MSDESALLAAVCAAPADDTPRLVYADWLDDDDADRPARAEFIRCQVEADRLHPDSARRADLEARAEALFADHWVDWWGEVCGAVGLPLPERPRTTRLGRLARRVVAGESVGRPYRRHQLEVSRRATRGWQAAIPAPEFWSARYRRGFPDRLELAVVFPTRDLQPFLARWAAAGPLAELTASSRPGDGFPPHDGPYLAGLTRLDLFDVTADALRPLLASPHLVSLSELRFEVTDPPGTFAPELAVVAASPAAPRLRRLEVPLPDEASAVALAGAERLGGLTALAVELEFEPAISGGTAGPFPPECDRVRLEVLARSPHLAGLTELSASGVLSPAGVRALVHNPTWAGLRTLTLSPLGDEDYVAALAACTLPDLIDLRLEDADLTHDGFRGLARLPLPRQLRHLRVTPPYETPDVDVLAVADALDPDRLETLAVRSPHLSGEARAELRRRFGDRVRFG